MESHYVFLERTEPYLLLHNFLHFCNSQYKTMLSTRCQCAFRCDLSAYKTRKQCFLNGRIHGGVVNCPRTYRFLKKLIHASYTSYHKVLVIPLPIVLKFDFYILTFDTKLNYFLNFHKLKIAVFFGYPVHGTNGHVYVFSTFHYSTKRSLPFPYVCLSVCLLPVSIFIRHVISEITGSIVMKFCVHIRNIM